MPSNTHYFNINIGRGQTESVTRLSTLTLHGVPGFAIHRHCEKGQWWLKVSHEETGGLAAKVPIDGEKESASETDLVELISLARERTKSRENILRAVAEYKSTHPTPSAT